MSFTPGHGEGFSIGLVTSAEDPLRHVFWNAYRKAGGRPMSHVFVVVPEMATYRSLRERVLEAYWMFGPTGCVRLAAWALRQRFVPTRSEFGDWGDDPGPGPRAAVHTVPRLTRSVLDERLAGESLDLLVSVGSPHILPTAVLHKPALGALNVHNAKLPQFRGHLGTFWEIFHRQTQGYVSIHEMVAKVDAGPVTAHGTVPLDGYAGFLDVLIAKKQLGGRLLAETVAHAAAHRRLPRPTAPRAVEPDEYYGWPRLAEVRRFASIRRTLRKGDSWR